MKARDISDALNYIDDDLITEAADFDVRKKRRAKISPIAIGVIAAAAAALVVAGIVIKMSSPEAELNKGGNQSYMYGGDDGLESMQIDSFLGGGGNDGYAVDGYDGYYATLGTVPRNVTADGGVEGIDGVVIIETAEEENYRFTFEDKVYESAREEAYEDMIGELIGQAESGEDIYSCLISDEMVLIDIDGTLYIAWEVPE